MKRLSLSIALNAVTAGGAPELVELIPAGPRVGGRDGRAWLFDELAAAEVLVQFDSRAVDLPVDWEHATQHRAPNGQAAPAAGWIKALELREGALWGHVEWTPRGADQVASREYRYLSPVFDYDPESGRIMRLVSAGLVNTPNLHLQALNSEEDASMKRSTLLAAAIAAIGLKADADDDALATAINSLKAERDTAQATNSEKAPSLERYVPRADYDALVQRAQNAEQAVKDRDAADLKAKVDTAIQGALEAGKITPATEEYHRASCSDSAGLERFQAFVAAAPAVAGDASEAFKKKPDGKATALNAEQREACRLLGIPEAEFAASLAEKE